MRHSSGVRWLLGAALVVLTPVLPAGAQDPGADSDFERAATASPDEMKSFAKDAILEMQAIVRALAQVDEDVRRKTEGGLLCVTNNLASARTLLQVSEAANKALDQALREGQRERAGYEVRKIAIALKKARLLQAEGERCAYGEGVIDGKSRSQVEGNQTSPDSDETADVPDDALGYGFDPPNASPF